MLVPDLEPQVRAWWTWLRAASVLNAALWVFAWAAAGRSRLSDRAEGFRRRQLALSSIFVLGCAFRSWFPRADVQRLCLVDSWLSSVALGRSVATAAELCFVAQWALTLRHLGERLRAPAAVLASRLIVPLIAVAEGCSWYAVLTTCYAGNFFEESIWTLSATLLVVAACGLWPRADARLRRILPLAIAAGTAYVAFMCRVDVPMYHARWAADAAAGRAYLPLLAGLRDAAARRTVSGAFLPWREEMAWMGLYFSAAVWLSVGLTFSPALLERRSAADAALDEGPLVTTS